jgi:hypothetical protein
MRDGAWSYTARGGFLEQPIRSGVSYPVVFGFERVGDVVVDVPVKTPTSRRPASRTAGDTGRRPSTNRALRSAAADPATTTWRG